eukprot:jgi/Chlat1/8951/Chrsp94S08329
MAGRAMRMVVRSVRTVRGPDPTGRGQTDRNTAANTATWASASLDYEELIDSIGEECHELG